MKNCFLVSNRAYVTSTPLFVIACFRMVILWRKYNGLIDNAPLSGQALYRLPTRFSALLLLNKDREMVPMTIYCLRATDFSYWAVGRDKMKPTKMYSIVKWLFYVQAFPFLLNGFCSRRYCFLNVFSNTVILEKKQKLKNLFVSWSFSLLHFLKWKGKIQIFHQ